MLSVLYDTFAQRLKSVRAVMIDHEIGLLLLTPGANMRYLTGYSEEGHERLLCLAIPIDSDPILLVPELNRHQALANPSGITDVRVWNDTDGWSQAFQKLICECSHDADRIALDDAMPARFVIPLSHIQSAEHFQLAGSLLGELRAVKNIAEISALKKAAAITEQGLLAGRAACRPGVTEREIAAVIETEFRAAAAVPSFDSIVAVGANASLPHHMPDNTQIKEGDIVLLDIGALVDDYRGDITRVFSVGTACDEAYKVYDIVYRAHQAAFDAVLPGATGASIDHAARRIIVDAGYGENFIHRTGHGIGLDPHEEPNISQIQNQPLRIGNCFSIEPGVYISGQFGVRLENIVTVTEHGAESLNASVPKCLEEA